jgi:hypothetical protein
MALRDRSLGPRFLACILGHDQDDAPIRTEAEGITGQLRSTLHGLYIQRFLSSSFSLSLSRTAGEVGTINLYDTAQFFLRDRSSSRVILSNFCR